MRQIQFLFTQRKNLMLHIVQDIPRKIKSELITSKQITQKEDNERPVTIGEIHVQENGKNANFANITNLPAQKDTATTDKTSFIRRNLDNKKVIIKNMSATFPGIPRRVRSYSTSKKQDKTNVIKLHLGIHSVPQNYESEVDNKA